MKELASLPAIVRRVARRVRGKIWRLGTFWIAPITSAHVRNIRQHEIEAVVGELPASGTLLEIGAASGWQAQVLARYGYRVHALELIPEAFAPNRIWPLIVYDGRAMPFPKAAFDIVFSSNVLEHVADLPELAAEMRRVLKPGGIAVHVVPSASWAFWSIATWWIKNGRLSDPHGSRARSAFQEIRFFTRREWREVFKRQGWSIIRAKGVRLFYTGSCIFGVRLPSGVRTLMSHFLGSSAHIFVVAADIPHRDNRGMQTDVSDSPV